MILLLFSFAQVRQLLGLLLKFDPPGRNLETTDESPEVEFSVVIRFFQVLVGICFGLCVLRFRFFRCLPGKRPTPPTNSLTPRCRIRRIPAVAPAFEQYCENRLASCSLFLVPIGLFARPSGTHVGFDPCFLLPSLCTWREHVRKRALFPILQRSDGVTPRCSKPQSFAASLIKGRARAAALCGQVNAGRSFVLDQDI